MLIAYTPFAWAAQPTVAIAGGAWLTTDGGAACVDGQPGRMARYQAAGVPTITITYPAAATLRIAAVLGIKGAAAGAAVSVTAGGVTVNGVLRRMFGGTLGCYLLINGAAPGAVVTFRLPAGTVDVGELVALPATETGHESDWSVERVDPSESARNRGSGLTTAARVPFRRLECNLEVVGKTQVRHGGLPGGVDLDLLAELLAGDRRCIFVPRYGRTGATDVDELNATAIYGAARLARSQHAGGDWYRSSAWAEEVPAY